MATTTRGCWYWESIPDGLVLELQEYHLPTPSSYNQYAGLTIHLIKEKSCQVYLFIAR